MNDDEKKYEDLRHLMTNSSTPARAARYLLYDEDRMKETSPEDQKDAGFRKYVVSKYQAVINPSSLATEDQIEFCRRVREEMEKRRAMDEAGWKTPVDEGYDAFDPKMRPVNWEGTANPYPAGSVDHSEWADGYNNAIMSAGAELDDAYEAMKPESEAEEKRLLEESSLDSLFVRVERLAKSNDNTFLALAAINRQMSMLGAFLMIVEHHIGKYLPEHLRVGLVEFVNRLQGESENREIERIGSVEDRLGDLKLILTDLRELGMEIAVKNIDTPYGIIGNDLYHFWFVIANHK